VISAASKPGRFRLVRRPDAAIQTDEDAPALSSPEAQRAVEQAIDEHLKPTEPRKACGQFAVIRSIIRLLTTVYRSPLLCATSAGVGKLEDATER